MHRLATIADALSPAVPGVTFPERPALAYEVETYTVYCADERIEISFWDLEQMIVRRGNPVCAFARYTSYSDAIRFVERNFGDEGVACSC